MKQKFCEKCLHLWGAYEDTCHCTGPCHNIEPCRQALEEHAEERADYEYFMFGTRYPGQ